MCCVVGEGSGGSAVSDLGTAEPPTFLAGGQRDSPTAETRHSPYILRVKRQWVKTRSSRWIRPSNCRWEEEEEEEEESENRKGQGPMARRKRRKQQSTKVNDHDIPVSTRRGMDVVKLRHEEHSEIKSPSLSHEDLCRLADGITVGQDK